MENIKLSNEGVVNIMEAIIDGVKKDFVRGYVYIMRHYHHIPSSKAFYKDIKQRKRGNRMDYDIYSIMVGYYEAVDFINKDPYGIFAKAGIDNVINEWTTIAKKRLGVRH